MPAQRKPTMRHYERIAARTGEAAKRHPWVTWATIAAIATVLSSLGPAALWAIGHFQTTDEFKHYAAKNEQRFAWMAFGLADLKAIILRNRLNECNAKRQAQGGRLVSIDDAACEQYKQEYDDAAITRQTLYNEARATGKP
jgi:hypothetical protein